MCTPVIQCVGVRIHLFLCVCVINYLRIGESFRQSVRVVILLCTTVTRHSESTITLLVSHLRSIGAVDLTETQTKKRKKEVSTVHTSTLPTAAVKCMFVLLYLTGICK